MLHQCQLFVLGEIDRKWLEEHGREIIDKLQSDSLTQLPNHPEFFNFMVSLWAKLEQEWQRTVKTFISSEMNKFYSAISLSQQ